MLKPISKIDNKYDILPDLSKKDISVFKYLCNAGINSKRLVPVPLWKIARDCCMKYPAAKYCINKLIKAGKIERFMYYKIDGRMRIKKHCTYKLI